MDFTTLESERQIEDFSAWVAEIGKPQVISPLLIFLIRSLMICIAEPPQPHMALCSSGLGVKVDEEEL